MELWVMVVQYACAAAGAAAVVRLVDGCGKGAKKNAPEVELGSVQMVQGTMPCENNTSITDILTFARGREKFGKKN